jgi:hypothetical protein
MEVVRALKITQALLMKTTANGCTPSEEAAASARAAAYMQRFNFTLLEETKPNAPRMPGMKQPCFSANYDTRLFSSAPFRWPAMVRTIGGVIGGFGLLCMECILW